MKQNAGFTLIETMIVAAILMTVIIGTPAIYAWLNRQGVGMAVDHMRAELQLARMMAIDRNRTCSVVLNFPESGQYVNSLNLQMVDLKGYRGGVHFLQIGPDGGKACERINFTRRGMAVPAGMIYLASQNKSVIYRLRVLAPGGVSVYHWNGRGWR
jgi:prepilin-type N-terminal cleavage/methylation domain-containing protein